MSYSRKPTTDEQAWLDAVREAGCIVCANEFSVYTPGVPHHMDGTSKENAHFFSIGLCFNHHQEGSDCKAFTSRHPHKRRFEARYGPEAVLFIQQLDSLSGVYNPYREHEHG